MKKRTIRFGLTVILVGLLLAAVLFIYMFNKPHLDIASEKPEFSLSAAQLYNDFKKDESSANKKYLAETNGKVIQISGFVSEKNKGEHGGLTLSVNEQSMTEGGISCSIDSTNIEKASKLKVGDRVVLKGECTGYIELTSEVDLIKCIIIE